MLESELLTAIAGTYKSIAQEPTTVWSENSAGITMRNVQIFIADDSQNPPIGNPDSVDYYVYHLGQDDESAYLPTGSAPLSSGDIATSISSKVSQIKE